MLSLRDKTITQTLKTPALGGSTNVGVRKPITNLTANCSKKYKPRKQEELRKRKARNEAI
jgi:hypothetical protein